MTAPAPWIPTSPDSDSRQLLGHPRQLWMLFMAEFWERFVFYGIRWALVLYIVTQFYGGSPAGQEPANLTYGSYLAMVYATAIFGGYIADRVLGYQRSILVGAAFMAAGLFAVSIPNPQIFKLGLATIVVGNGMFKPNISTMVGKLYAANDPRRDSGFTIFYMGINGGAFIAPVLTQLLAQKVFGTMTMPAYQVVFLAAAAGMIVSLVWFAIGRRQLGSIGMPPAGAESPLRVAHVVVGAAVVVPLVYLLLAAGAAILQTVLMLLFLPLAAMLLLEGIREGKVARDKVIAMLIIFVFNVLFWMFFEQAGSSFSFLAENIVDRDLGGFVFPTAWFQSVNSIAIIACAPIVAWVWLAMDRVGKNPSIPRKFGLGLLGNAFAFLVLMYALSHLVDANNKIPFWTLVSVYVLQSIGELCLSPIGLSMVTKLAPTRIVGLGMGGWFLSIGIGNNLAGIFAGHVSGKTGLSVQSALAGYTFGFASLLVAGVVLVLLAPLIRKLMHGVT